MAPTGKNDPLATGQTAQLANLTCCHPILFRSTP